MSVAVNHVHLIKTTKLTRTLVMYNSLLFVCQDYIFVATDMSLTLDVHDKTSGTRLRKWDIDAAIYDVIIVASKSPVTHGKHQPTHILYMHFIMFITTARNINLRSGCAHVTPLSAILFSLDRR